MAQQTAVEWLQIKMATSPTQEMVENINVWFKEAKEMEREQIVQAYVEGINLVPCDVNSTDELDAEKYYHKTFGNK